MRKITTFAENENGDIVASQPKKNTIDLIKQFARVYTPITTIAFSQLIAN